MPKRKISVTYLTDEGWVKSVFTDWFDFAGWLKQATLPKEANVCIKSWEYVDA